jgi:putative hydrolase of the HAD superfamily
MIKGYIFDYGGTLDTGGNHWGQVIWHAYERQQVPVSKEHFCEAYVYAERTLGKNPIIKPEFTFRKTLETKLRLQLDYLHEHVSSDNPLELAVSSLMAFDSSIKPLMSYLYPLLDDLYEQTNQQTFHSREVLMALQRHYPLVLVSNFYGNIHTVLREFGFESMFQQVIESAVVGVRKPDPRIFTLGVEALRLDPTEVVVVGDSFDKDIIPAREAGCQTIWFKGEPWSVEEIDESIPDKIITDLGEIL